MYINDILPVIRIVSTIFLVQILKKKLTERHFNIPLGLDSRLLWHISIRIRVTRGSKFCIEKYSFMPKCLTDVARIWNGDRLRVYPRLIQVTFVKFRN